MNAAEELPPDLKAFVFTCIDALEQVELLARLHASTAPQPAGAVARDLGITATAARHHLETLAARGLLQIEVGDEVTYRFDPKSDELRRYAARLLEHYASSRMAVIRAIQGSRGLKSFADAFKLRGDT